MTEAELMAIQIDHEELYSRTLFQAYLNDFIDTQLEAQAEEDESEIKDMVLAYEWWCNEDHGYDSKNARAQLMGMGEPLDFIFQALLFIIPLQHPVTIQTTAAAIMHKVPALGDMDTKLDKAKTCCELVVFLSAYTGLYEIIITEGSDGVLVNSLVVLEEDIVQRMQDTMYIPPSLVKPKHRVKNSDSAYQLVPKPALADSNARHKMHLNLNALNLAGDVPFTVDAESFYTLHDLEPAKQELTPAQEQARVHNHNDKVLVAENIAKAYYELQTPLYFGWFFDSRGRMYPEGYHLTPNGDKYEKANLLLANTEIPTGDFDL